MKQLSTHDGGRTFQIIIETLRNLGYTVYSTILNSLDFGVPQRRRTYIVGFIDNVPFEFPKGGVPFNLESILEKEQQIPNKYYASDYIRQKRIAALKGVPLYQVFGMKINREIFQHFLIHVL